MAGDFCHLHNHTEYSLLDGANRIGNLAAYAKELEMNSIAISDHGVMFGVMDFYAACKKNGVKPIIGVEAYVAPQGHLKKSGRKDAENFHLLLLAKNELGYRNLCRLSTIAALEGYYYKPRVDHELLRKYSEGLIATTTCLGSEVCQALMANDYDSARETVRTYVEIFGQENYFVELQDHGLPEQHQIQEDLLRLAKEFNLKVIATNDAHYMRREDAKPHDLLLCVQTGTTVSDTNRLKFSTEEFYIKSRDEMAELFKGVSGAIENTMLISDLCQVELDKQRAPMPQPDIPSGRSSREYLTELANEGLVKKATANDTYLARLNYELDVITKTGYEDYFLLVREFANATRDRGIRFGVRGSAAASLVSYTIGITDIDPIEYELTFERFLNPERVSMPDIDMDFEDARRDEIINWVSDKYGRDHVAQIITFGTLGAKAAIRDAARAMGVALMDADKICKLMPTRPDLTLDMALKNNKELEAFLGSRTDLAPLIESAKSIEGISRHVGVHAAGVVISREPLVEYLPMYRGQNGQTVTAFDMGTLEKMGMLKMDFLGLSNLTVLARAVENIEKATGEKVVLEQIPLEDPAAFQIISDGKTTGIFQMESGGMTKNVTQLKPQSIRELAAMIALYRPGPMEQLPKYIDHKFGRSPVVFLDERMRPILEETYGIIVYQDQVLRIVQALAGFSLGKADILRRAMGKKDAKQMASMQGEFYEGCEKNKVDPEVAKKLWEDLQPFAGYAFNKAHAVCYAFVAYQTAYLKANYPRQYMAALLAVYREKEDRVTAFIEECRRMQIPVTKPDVNKSDFDFTVQEDGSIRFGLGAIKGVGDGIVQNILANRSEEGPYTNLFEFAERLRTLGLNKTAFESLVKAGAFDELDPNRNRLLQLSAVALAWAEQSQKERSAGQDSLFLDSAGPEVKVYPNPTLDVPMPNRPEILAMEKEVFGIYVSDHPLRGYRHVIEQASDCSCTEAKELEGGTAVRIAGLLTAVKVTTTKRGDKMARISLEDFSGVLDGIVFSKVYEQSVELLKRDSVVLVSGRISVRDSMPDAPVELRVESVRPISLDDQPMMPEIYDEAYAGKVTVDLRMATLEQLGVIRGAISEFPGSHQVRIIINNGKTFPPIVPLRTVNPDKFSHALKMAGVRATIQVETTAK